MYILNNQAFDAGLPQIVGDVQYPPNWFDDQAHRDQHGILTVFYVAPPSVTSTQKLVSTGFVQDGQQRWVQQWSVVNKTSDELAADAVMLTQAKMTKNLQINDWREAANFTTFPYGGKLVACDSLSRSDIDGVANNISLMNAFPAGFPNAWKFTDNTYTSIPDIATFKVMYSAMTAQGTANFSHSQALKTTLAAATTLAQVDAIVW